MIDGRTSNNSKVFNLDICTATRISMWRIQVHFSTFKSERQSDCARRIASRTTGCCSKGTPSSVPHAVAQHILWRFPWGELRLPTVVPLLLVSHRLVLRQLVPRSPGSPMSLLQVDTWCWLHASIVWNMHEPCRHSTELLKTPQLHTRPVSCDIMGLQRVAQCWGGNWEHKGSTWKKHISASQ